VEESLSNMLDKVTLAVALFSYRHQNSKAMISRPQFLSRTIFYYHDRRHSYRSYFMLM